MPVTIGAISFDADTGLGYSLPLQNNSNLRSWYQIASVPSTTSVGIYTNSVAGAAAYNGNAPWTGHPDVATKGGYVIKPAVRILLLSPPELGSAGAICETSNASWVVGDQVECAICPWPDVHGWDYRIAQWTPGGIRRSFMSLSNYGPRMIGIGLGIGATAGSNILGRPGNDAFAFDTSITLGPSASYGILIDNSAPNTNAGAAALRISQGYTDTGDPAIARQQDAGSRIPWGSQNGDWHLGRVYDNKGLGGVVGNNAHYGPVRLDFIGSVRDGSMSTNPYQLAKMQFDGYLRLNGDNFYQSSLIEFANRNDYSTSRSQIYGAVPKGDGGGTGLYRNVGLDFKIGLWSWCWH
jgi:hypothetical protein